MLDHSITLIEVHKVSSSYCMMKKPNFIARPRKDKALFEGSKPPKSAHAGIRSRNIGLNLSSVEDRQRDR